MKIDLGILSLEKLFESGKFHPQRSANGETSTPYYKAHGLIVRGPDSYLAKIRIGA